MTRERARTERRDLDKERGEPLAGGAARGGPRALRERPPRRSPNGRAGRGSSITNDDGVESRGLLALKQALEPMGDVTVVAPDTNQSAVGHQKTLMRPLRVRERTLADGSLAYSVDGSPTDAVSVAFLGYFGHGFDLVASGINYGANLGDDITYSGTVSAAMEAVINSCPAFAISQEYYEHPDFSLAGRWPPRPSRATSSSTACRRASSINVNVPAATRRGVRRRSRSPAWASGSTRTSSSAAGSARHPLLLDRRSAAVGAGRPGDGLPRGRQPAHRGHADPSRPDRPPPAQAAADLGLGDAVGAPDPQAWALRLNGACQRRPPQPPGSRRPRSMPRGSQRRRRGRPGDR